MATAFDGTAIDLSSQIALAPGGENLRVCLTCGECVSRCFLTDGYPDMNPRKLIRKVLMGREIEAADSEFIWACTLCGRCTTDCPKGLKMDVIVRELRSLARNRGKAPARIVEGVEKALEVGNNTGIASEEFVDTAEWMAEEAEEEMEGMEEGGLAVPFDRHGAEFLYVPNPREYTSNPQMFQTYLKFFFYAGVDWTLSSKFFDITNWAYYLGDTEAATTLVKNLVEETRRLGAKSCCPPNAATGSRSSETMLSIGWANHWASRLCPWWNSPTSFTRKGGYRSSPGPSKARVTYHDPCNVGRKLGIYEPPRELDPCRGYGFR